MHVSKITNHVHFNQLGSRGSYSTRLISLSKCLGGEAQPSAKAGIPRNLKQTGDRGGGGGVGGKLRC